jgi:hypothetical protein
MIEAGLSRREEGLDQLGLAELGQEAECVASNKFVGMLKVVPNAVAVSVRMVRERLRCDLPNQNHLLLQLSVGVQLRADFVVEVQQFLQWLAFRGHDETNDMHE